MYYHAGTLFLFSTCLLLILSSWIEVRRVCMPCSLNWLCLPYCIHFIYFRKRVHTYTRISTMGFSLLQRMLLYVRRPRRRMKKAYNKTSLKFCVATCCKLLYDIANMHFKRPYTYSTTFLNTTIERTAMKIS